jgi:integrase
VLSVYRRHRATCKFADDRVSKKCRCAIWATGTLDGKPYRQSLKTRNFERAEQRKREIESGNAPAVQPKHITITEAVERLIADSEARNLNRSTMAKYKLLAGRLRDFAVRERITDLRDFTHDHALAFRASWKGAPRTRAKTLERFRSWFNFFVQNGWIAANPARGIKSPEVRPSPTLPFGDGEVSKILAHAEGKARTFFKVLLHSGLRIIDAAQLRPERIENRKLFLFQQKTGIAVRVPLPPDVLADLTNLPLVGGFYFASSPRIRTRSPSTIASGCSVRLKPRG